MSIKCLCKTLSILSGRRWRAKIISFNNLYVTFASSTCFWKVICVDGEQNKGTGLRKFMKLIIFYYRIGRLECKQIPTDP